VLLGEFNPSLVSKETAHCKAISYIYNTTQPSTQPSTRIQLTKWKYNKVQAKTPSLTPRYMDCSMLHGCTPCWATNPRVNKDSRINDIQEKNMSSS